MDGWIFLATGELKENLQPSYNLFTLQTRADNVLLFRAFIVTQQLS